MTKVCAYVECGRAFEPKTHNQRYCDMECCRRATNARLMEQYYERKARRQGHIRVCSTDGCTTKLSRYNDDKTCNKCQAELASVRRDKLLRLIAS